MSSDLSPPPPRAPVLLVTSCADLAGDVERLAAAVAVPVDRAPDAGAAGRRWLQAALVLLGPDAAAMGAPPRRPGVVLVAGHDAGDRVWRLAVEAGAEAVAQLPADQERLLDRLAAVADGETRASRVIGVVGGRGGAGASTLAGGMAVTAAASGRDVLLVDADSLGGGLDVLLGVEGSPGLRWSDLSRARGAVRPAALADGLPRLDGLRVLSWEREDAAELPAAAMEAVLDAGRRGHDLVVVDLPRSAGPAAVAALWRLDALVLVVPAEVRATVAASRLLAAVAPHVADVRLVVRGPAASDLSAEAVADALGLPLTARCGADGDLAGDADRGVPPASRGRGALARLCRGLLAELAEPAAPEGAARGAV